MLVKGLLVVMGCAILALYLWVEGEGVFRKVILKGAGIRYWINFDDIRVTIL